MVAFHDPSAVAAALAAAKQGQIVEIEHLPEEDEEEQAGPGPSCSSSLGTGLRGNGRA